jgi:hypothetical protein
MKKKAYPKIVYAQLKKEGNNEEYWNIFEQEYSDLLDDGEVGLYEFKGIQIKKTEITID